MVDTAKYDGKSWKIRYFEVEEFVDDLVEFGKLLDSLEENNEEVLAIVPNIGFVKASLVLGTGFQGVKGLAVVIGKSRGK